MRSALLELGALVNQMMTIASMDKRSQSSGEFDERPTLKQSVGVKRFRHSALRRHLREVYELLQERATG